MDRRESIKSLLIGSLGTGMIVQGCADPEDNRAKVSPSDSVIDYGRTSKEKERDARLQSEQFFSEQELTTIAILCDIILPAKGDIPSANDAEVPDFIEFIVKDLPYHQLPIRGGLMWLDQYCNTQYNASFSAATEAQRIQIVDQIAYPNPTSEYLQPGVSFFNRIRNLVLTGYFTSKEGIAALGYQGNVPNVWDGVPQEVLDDHGLFYDDEWMEKCVDQSKRNVKAEWDDDGNLLT